MVIGHVYYFLEDIFPNQPGGRRMLFTPQALKNICDPSPEVDQTRAPLNGRFISEGRKKYSRK